MIGQGSAATGTQHAGSGRDGAKAGAGAGGPNRPRRGARDLTADHSPADHDHPADHDAADHQRPTTTPPITPPTTAAPLGGLLPPILGNLIGAL